MNFKQKLLAHSNYYRKLWSLSITAFFFYHFYFEN